MAGAALWCNCSGIYTSGNTAVGSVLLRGLSPDLDGNVVFDGRQFDYAATHCACISASSALMDGAGTDWDAGFAVAAAVDSAI